MYTSTPGIWPIQLYVMPFMLVNESGIYKMQKEVRSTFSLELNGFWESNYFFKMNLTLVQTIIQLTFCQIDRFSKQLIWQFVNLNFSFGRFGHLGFIFQHWVSKIWWKSNSFTKSSRRNACPFLKIKIINENPMYL